MLRRLQDKTSAVLCAHSRRNFLLRKNIWVGHNFTVYSFEWETVPVMSITMNAVIVMSTSFANRETFTKISQRYSKEKTVPVLILPFLPLHVCGMNLLTNRRARFIQAKLCLAAARTVPHSFNTVGGSILRTIWILSIIIFYYRRNRFQKS